MKTGDAVQCPDSNGTITETAQDHVTVELWSDGSVWIGPKGACEPFSGDTVPSWTVAETSTEDQEGERWDGLS